MKMLALYEQLLSIINHTVDEDGYVSVTYPETGATHGATINDKILVLPTEDRVSRNDPNHFFFHPLKEDFRQGVSPVLEYYKKHALAEISEMAGATMVGLLLLANDKETQKELTPEQSEALDHGKTATKDTANRFMKFLVKAREQKIDLIHVYLCRAGKDAVTGEVYSQLATVTFPLYEHFIANPTNPLGEKFTKADQKAIEDVFQYVFPGIGKEHQFSYGSNSMQAPKLDALMGAMRNLLSQIVVIHDLLKSTKWFADTPEIQTEWFDSVGELELLRKEIMFTPMQAGNEGSTDVAKRQTTEVNLGRESRGRDSEDSRDVRRDTRDYRDDRIDDRQDDRNDEDDRAPGFRRLSRADVDRLEDEQIRRNEEAYDDEYEVRTGRRRRGVDRRDDMDDDRRRRRDSDDYDHRHRSSHRDRDRERERGEVRGRDTGGGSLAERLERDDRSRSRSRYDDDDDYDDRRSSRRSRSRRDDYDDRRDYGRSSSRRHRR